MSDPLILFTSRVFITLSNNPWTTSNPALLLHQTAAACLTFLACLSKLRSFNTTSVDSNTLIGSGCDLFSRIVLSRPGMSEVRTTWNSRVFGFPILTAVFPLSTLFNHSKFSSCEHWGQKVQYQHTEVYPKLKIFTNISGRTSTKPA